MNSSYGTKSIILFAFAIIALLLLTYFEAAFIGISTFTERMISIVLLVLPGLTGVVFGVFGAVKKEPRKWVAIAGIVLNGLFTTFMILILSFAG